MAGIDVKRVDFSTRKEYIRAYQKAWQEKNKGYVKDYQKSYHEKNKDKNLSRSRSNYQKRRDYYINYRRQRRDKTREWMLQSRYGLTVEEFNEKLEEQNFRCAICGNEDHGSRNWHIDHDHNDGEVRGLLCNNCNGGLGFFKDDIKLLQKAVEYLSPCSTK